VGFFICATLSVEFDSLMFRSLTIALSIFFLSSAFAEAASINMPKSASQGEVVKILITDPNNEEYRIQFSPVGWPQNKKIILISAVNLGGGKQMALIPIAPDEVTGLALITIFAASSGNTHAIEIKKANFQVAKGVTFVGDPKGKLKEKFDDEKNELKRIFALSTPERFWKEDLKFVAPLKDMAVTSPFGQIRHKFSRKDGKWDANHFGADLHADVWTHVYAAEKGIVRLATKFLAEGKIIIIDHGYGLFSLYFHLSRLQVHDGDFVKKGDMIALSGQTGASIGPHLHFEIRLNGVAVSPWNFMQEPPMFKQKAASPPFWKKRGAK